MEGRRGMMGEEGKRWGHSQHGVGGGHCRRLLKKMMLCLAIGVDVGRWVRCHGDLWHLVYVEQVGG